MQLLDGQQEAHVNTVFPQHPQKLFTRNPAIYFPQVDKTYVQYQPLAFYHDCSIICWRAKIYSVVLRPRRKPHWVSSSFGSIIFAASWHTLFLGGLCRGSWFIHSCLHFFVWDDQFANLSEPFQNAGVLTKRHVTRHTGVSQTIQRSKFP